MGDVSPRNRVKSGTELSGRLRSTVLSRKTNLCAAGLEDKDVFLVVMPSETVSAGGSDE